MDKQKLFIGFLESIREQNPALVEAVKEGYVVYMEAVLKTMDHTEYPESLKNRTDSVLHHIMQDARAAMKAMPDNPNNGYYADEINYCADELYRRKKENRSVTEAAQPAIRTRPHPVFHAEDADVTDNKDHFPLGSVAQARNALARVAHYSSVPEWWTGKSLKALQNKVKKAVKAEYPSIEVGE